MTIRVLEAEDVDQMHLLLESNWHPVASHHLLCLRKHIIAAWKFGLLVNVYKAHKMDSRSSAVPT